VQLPSTLHHRPRQALLMRRRRRELKAPCLHLATFRVP
jgi:hypothetical protein